MPVKTNIKTIGIQELNAKIKRLPANMKGEVNKGWAKVAAIVLADRGGGKQTYPPETKANRPPAPYYIRGTGTQTASGNLNNSQQLERHYYFNPQGTKLTIGNRGVKYNIFIIGYPNSMKMKSLGWKSLYEIAKSKFKDIVKVITKSVDDAIRKTGLK